MMMMMIGFDQKQPLTSSRGHGSDVRSATYNKQPTVW
jgi:hypothetical protein